jgi:hypothetical protein
VGDWDGDGIDTIGLFDPARSMFFLRNSNSGGVADSMFRYGPMNSGWQPLAGDWDGDGTDTVGLFNPANQTMYLQNENAPGNADVLFQYAALGASWVPLAGDWDGVPALAAGAQFASGLLAGEATSLLGGSSSASTAESAQPETASGLLAATVSRSVSTGGATALSALVSTATDSGAKPEQGTDEALDLALLEVAGELSLGGLIDPAI